MSAHWHIGMKVVCIKGAPASSHTTGRWAPQTGQVYTVRGVYLGVWGDQLNLEEYHHSERHTCGAEIGWQAGRFRPVQTRATDISVFTAMLNPTKVDA